jgi:hypothetical protein
MRWYGGLASDPLIAASANLAVISHPSAQARRKHLRCWSSMLVARCWSLLYRQ